MQVAPFLLHAVPNILGVAGFGQALEGMLLARQFRGGPLRRNGSPCPPVTVLKPLHGNEELLEEALSSFCTLDWPELQILCGVADPNDPAIAVVERVRRAYPQARLDLVQNAQVLGHNRKVSNLIHMLPYAAHEILVISDSDMHVAPDYLRRVTSSLSAAGVGLVTSLYVGRLPKDGIVPQLAAAQIAQIFAPGALLARKLGRQDCLGATMALTKTTLARIGGFERLLAFVADDAWMGKFVADLGMEVRLCAAIPATTIAESDFSSLWQHELRWARTVRSVEPVGFAASILQFPLLFFAINAVLMHHHLRARPSGELPKFISVRPQHRSIWHRSARHFRWRYGVPRILGRPWPGVVRF